MHICTSPLQPGKPNPHCYEIIIFASAKPLNPAPQVTHHMYAEACLLQSATRVHGRRRKTPQTARHPGSPGGVTAEQGGRQCDVSLTTEAAAVKAAGATDIAQLR
jgi:hypothetical protein